MCTQVLHNLRHKHGLAHCVVTLGLPSTPTRVKRIVQTTGREVWILITMLNPFAAHFLGELLILRDTGLTL
jgi:hypothetical protein